MNKLLLSMINAVALFASCVKDDENTPGGKVVDNLVTPELANMAVSSTSLFSGALTVSPCSDNSSLYFGNYNSGGSLSPLNSNYIIINGVIATAPLPVRLPVGDYNFLYWGVVRNSQSDSTYADIAIRDPALRLGTDLKEQTFSLRKVSNLDTTYMPVYDFVHAVQPIYVGKDKMQAVLQRTVAGLKVTLTNRDGMTMDPSIASAKILIGSIANNLNYYSAEPSDFTKTVVFKLSMSADSLSISANSTVLVFPSGNSPLLTIALTLQSGQEKLYRKPLSSPLTAGNRLTLNITLGSLIVEEGSSNDFEVVGWTETAETINFP